MITTKNEDSCVEVGPLRPSFVCTHLGNASGVGVTAVPLERTSDGPVVESRTFSGRSEGGVLGSDENERPCANWIGNRPSKAVVSGQTELALGVHAPAVRGPRLHWVETTKADQRCRLVADRHYTRRTPGHPMWTRPGYCQILYYRQANGRQALFCWWRPKWEAGIPGTERKDGLRAIECIMFRNETRVLSSALIREAVQMVATWEHALDVEWPDGLITGVNAAKTIAGRSPEHEPGWCFRAAGWTDFPHATGRADVWLHLPTNDTTAADAPTGGER